MLTVTTTAGQKTFTSVDRWCTDEHNNLCIHSLDGVLLALYAPGSWLTATWEASCL